jgi:hypothetical protein
MKGFAVTALVLIGLDVLLRAPASRVTALFAEPAKWLAAWVDPGKPLIGPGHLADASSASSASSGPLSTAADFTGGFINPLQAAQQIGQDLARSQG